MIGNAESYLHRDNIPLCAYTTFDCVDNKWKTGYTRDTVIEYSIIVGKSFQIFG